MTRFAPLPESAYARHRRPGLLVRLFGRLVVTATLAFVVGFNR